MGIPRRLSTAMAAVGLLVTSSGCVTDRNAAPSSACADVAVLAESFPVGEAGPTGTGAIVAPLAELVASLEERVGQAEVGARRAARVLLDGEQAAAGQDGVADPEWLDAFDTVDTWAIAACGFSLRTLVLEGVDPDVAAELPAIAPSPQDLDGLLDWADVLARVRDTYPDRTWVDDGYAGNVGVGPGVNVVVRGVPNRTVAARVCDDVVGMLAEEADAVWLTVLSAGGSVLAESASDGVCEMTPAPEAPDTT